MSDAADQVVNFLENQQVESVWILDLTVGAERTGIVAGGDYDLIKVCAGNGTMTTDKQVTSLPEGALIKVEGGHAYSIVADCSTNLLAQIYKVNETHSNESESAQ